MRVGLFAHPEPEIEGGVPIEWKFEDIPKGYIRIYKEPEAGVPYVLGGDTAGEGSDCFTAHVVDNRTGEQVAELQQPLSEILYARRSTAWAGITTTRWRPLRSTSPPTRR